LKLAKILLSPFALLFFLILKTRNFLYDKAFFGVTRFDIPVISVGNLSFGGTGKTPHIEYLVKLLWDQNPAVLSRGYRRKTSGYLFANPDTPATQIGDEPRQIKSRFPNLPLAVSENRVLGIPNLLFDAPETGVVLLDDGFQHRPVKPGLNILLTEYRLLFTRDFLAPMGTLREYKSAYKRADLIVVSKCPENLSLDERKTIIREINPLPHQKVFFSHLRYGQIYHWLDLSPLKKSTPVFFAGIANTSSIENYLSNHFKSYKIRKFKDHHLFSFDELRILQDEIKSLGDDAFLLTTEKDLSKLLLPEYRDLLINTPLYVLPVEVEFNPEDAILFNQTVKTYVDQTKPSYRIP